MPRHFLVAGHKKKKRLYYSVSFKITEILNLRIMYIKIKLRINERSYTVFVYVSLLL